MPMISVTADPKEISSAGIPPLAMGPISLSRLQVFFLSIWCGLLAGLLEVGVIVLRKHTVDLNHFYWMSRHFLWLIPLTDLLIFFGLGLALSFLIRCWPRRGSYYAARSLCGFTLLAVIWAAFPRIYGPAGFIVALGIAARLVPLLERNPASFWRFVRFSFPMLAALAAIPAASIFGGDTIKERGTAARPLPPPGSPNVLLIVLDTVAADHLSLHGYARPTSRTIDQLSRQGIRFDRVRATSSWTLPSHASMFTGRWPHELSAGWLTPLDAAYPTLAEYLGSRGYDTAGFIANLFYCGSDSGLARGFAQYHDYIFPELTALKLASLISRPLEGLRSIDDFMKSRLDIVSFQGLLSMFDAGNRKSASVVNQQFLDWSAHRRQPERPFFAFLNYFDAHFPYKLPERGIHRFGVRPRTEREMYLIDHWRTLDKRELSVREIAFVRDCYDDCIAALDEQLGKLADELALRGLLERTWVIVTSDHGESFGEHLNVFGHGTSLYQTQLHVPLVIIPPGRNPSKRVVSETVSLRDLAATIVDVLNLKTGAPFPGESFARSWAQADMADHFDSSAALSEVVLTNILNPEPAQMLEERQVWASLAEGDWIYIRREGNIEELFDLRDDAAELHNHAQDPPIQSVLERMRETLNKMTAGPLTRDRFKP
jgi:arylsulfatase A-like enzyme